MDKALAQTDGASGASLSEEQKAKALAEALAGLDDRRSKKAPRKSRSRSRRSSSKESGEVSAEEVAAGGHEERRGKRDQSSSSRSDYRGNGTSKSGGKRYH